MDRPRDLPPDLPFLDLRLPPLLERRALDLEWLSAAAALLVPAETDSLGVLLPALPLPLLEVRLEVNLLVLPLDVLRERLPERFLVPFPAP